MTLSYRIIITSEDEISEAQDISIGGAAAPRARDLEAADLPVFVEMERVPLLPCGSP
jgi:hypothetical protein